MTQAIQVEATAGAASATNAVSLQTKPPDTGSETSLFAQLLAIVQNLSPAGELEQTFSASADGPQPEQQPPSAGEIEQAAALLGLPLCTPQAQPAPLPEAHSAGVERSTLPVQIAIAPQVATDLPAPVNPPDDAKVEHRSEAATPLLADGDLATLAAQQASNQPEVAPQVPPVVVMPSQGEATQSNTVPAQQMADTPAQAAPASPEGTPQKPHTPSEGTTTAAAAQNPAIAPAQSGQAGQMQSEQRQGHQDTATITPRSTRLQAKKQATFAVAEKPSPHRVPEVHLHGAQGVHAVSTAQRAQEATAQPAEVSPAEVVWQVARQIETMTSQRSTSSVTLQLEPEHLGRLRVTISFNEGTIHTHIVADNHAVRQMLESNSSLLQQALQQRGLQLGALQVSVQGDGRQFLLQQPYSPPARGWLETEPGVVDEARFGWSTSAGVNLLV